MNFEKPEKPEFWKNQKKEKKLLEISSFYTCVPKPQLYEVQLLRYGVRQNFFVILGYFLPFYPHPPNNPENQNFDKMKKASGDVIILKLCNKKQNHMMYGSRDIQCKGKSFFSFWAIFAFDPPNNPKNQNFEILALSFSHEYHQWKSYDVWFLRYGAQ